MTDATSTQARLARPLVSVIVPVYQVEAYLETCLESLVHQSLQAIEIVLIDDGSRDGSAAIVDRYVTKYPSIISAHRTPNRGLSAARNLGIELSRGVYIGFVDSDDWVHPDMFKALYDCALASDADVVVCGARKYFDRSHRYKQIPMRGSYFDYGGSVSEKPTILTSSKSFAWNKIYLRELWVENKFEFPPGHWFEDSAVIYNVLRTAKRVSYVPNCFYNYRVDRAGSITQDFSPKLFDVFKSCDAIIRYDEAHPTDHPDMGQVIETLVGKHIFARFRSLEARSTLEDRILARRYIEEAFAYMDAHFPDWRDNGRHGETMKRSSPVRLCRGRVSTVLFVFSPYWLRSLFKSRKSGLARQVKEMRKHLKLLKQNRKTKDMQRKLQTSGLRILAELNDALSRCPVVHFVDSQTLRRVVRDGSFGPRDVELACGVIATNEEIETVDNALQSAGFELRETFAVGGRVARSSYHSRSGVGRGSVKVNVDFYDASGAHAKTWLCYRDPNLRLGAGDFCAVELVYSRIRNTTEIVIGGQAIPIPENADQFLREKYGSAWKVSDPNRPDWKSPAATGRRLMGRIIKGSNGVDDCLHLGDLAHPAAEPGE
jgi:glycosyltransferase involved in cell wall biosynthesis